MRPDDVRVGDVYIFNDQAARPWRGFRVRATAVSRRRLVTKVYFEAEGALPPNFQPAPPDAWTVPDLLDPDLDDAPL